MPAKIFSDFYIGLPKDHLITIVDMYNKLIYENRYIRCRVNSIGDLDLHDISTNPCLDEGPIAVVGNNCQGFIVQKENKQQLMIFKATYGSGVTFYADDATISLLREIPRGKLVQYLIDNDWLINVKIYRTQINDDSDYIVNKT